MSVEERMRDLLKKAPEKDTDTERNVLPKRKAATESRKKRVVEDSELDDSDTDSHFDPHPHQESSSSDASLMSDNNNELEPEKPTKSSRKS